MRAGSLWESAHDCGTEQAAPQLGRAEPKTSSPTMVPHRRVRHCPGRPCDIIHAPSQQGSSMGWLHGHLRDEWTSWDNSLSCGRGYFSRQMQRPQVFSGVLPFLHVHASPAQHSDVTKATCATQTPATRQQLYPSRDAEVKRPTQ